MTESPPPPDYTLRPPLGIHPSFCSSETTTLVLREKAFDADEDSGDRFLVKNPDGKTVLVCEKVKGSREIKDARGVLLYRIESKLLSMSTTLRATGPDGKEVLSVKKKFGSKTMQISFLNAGDGATTELELQGDFYAGSAQLLLPSSSPTRTIAKISKRHNNTREMYVNDVALDQRSYFITIPPNVDVSLVAAVCVCLDEGRDEQRHPRKAKASTAGLGGGYGG